MRISFSRNHVPKQFFIQSEADENSKEHAMSYYVSISQLFHNVFSIFPVYLKTKSTERMRNTMTRGKIIIITDEGTYRTTEFNGDMYFECYGEEVARKMREINSKTDLLNYEKEFNKMYFDYPEEMELYQVDETDDMFDMGIDYYKRWSSDYLFIKNASNKDIAIKQKNGSREYILLSGKTVVLHFGNIAEDFRSIFENSEPLDNLHEVRYAVAQKAGTIYFPPNDIYELSAIMKKYEYKEIRGAYKSRTDYARNYVSGHLEKWMEKYFNFEKLGEDIMMSPEIGVVELPSGNVVTLF